MDRRRPPILNGTLIPYDSSVKELTAQLEYADSRAWAAIAALGFKDDLASLDLLVQLLTHRDWSYRYSAVLAIKNHAKVNVVLHIVRSLLHDASQYVVRAACSILAELKDYGCRDSIIRLLSTSERDTRLSALSSLKELWAPSDIDLVISIYHSDNDEMVHRAAGFIMWENSNENNWQRLLNCFWNDPLPRHRLWACQLIGKFGDFHDHPQLVALLDNKDGHIRKAANKALTHFLGEALSDLSERCWCAGWLGQCEYTIPELCRRVLKRGNSQTWGHGEVTYAEAKELTELADELGHWVAPAKDSWIYVPFNPFPIPNEVLEELDRMEAFRKEKQKS